MTRMPAKEICEALGIDPSCTSGLIIKAESPFMLTVEFTMHVRDEKLDALIEVFKRYHLQEKPEKV